MRAVREMGATAIAEPVGKALVDEANRLVTTPAYMIHDAPIHAVFEGIGEMVERALELAGGHAKRAGNARSGRGAPAAT